MNQTESRTVLITGSAKRIGRHIALDLAKDGWNVAIHYNDSEKEAKATKDDIERLGAKAFIVKANLGETENVGKIIKSAQAELGPISCLINNASLFEYDSPKDFTLENVHRHMRINLYAPLELTKEFANRLPKDTTGCVINLLDQKTHNLNPDFFSYTLSKIALESATKMFASTLGPNIRICGLAPGITLPSGEQTDTGFEAAHQLAPLGKSSSPEDIINAVKYLISAKSITGHTLIVDGGQHLWPTKRDVQFETTNS